MKKNRRIVMPLLVFILVIGGWELYVRVFDISLYILPSPSKIISALIENFDILMQHSLVTLEESILGLLISSLRYLFQFVWIYRKHLRQVFIHI